MSNIAVVTPSVRPDQYKSTFLSNWKYLFEKHDVTTLVVWDEEDPMKTVVEVSFKDGIFNHREAVSITEILGENSDLVCNRYAGVRNLGFAYIGLRMPKIDYIICLDDDVTPIGDTILDHIDALNSHVPISWMAVGDTYTRGFPYGVREEAEVVLSHGVWEGVPDLDSPTQLIRGNHPMSFYKMPIPKGVLFPMGSMNMAFKRKLLPYMYMCPQLPGELERCDDIWCGIECKKIIDSNSWAAVTGYAKVFHERASNVFSNLVKESKFIKLNETYWQGDESDHYFEIYRERRMRWQKLLSES